MVVGGINVSESARAAGDDYRTRDVLLVEALSTLVAGFCGGVAQTTPYIGQPAYKHMGARSGYTLLTGLFIGLGGMLRLRVGAGAVAAAGGAGADHRLRRPGHHRAGVPRNPAQARHRGGAGLPALDRVPADDQVRQSGVDSRRTRSPRSTTAPRPWLAGPGHHRDPGQRLHHHRDDLDHRAGGDDRRPHCACRAWPCWSARR